MANCKNCGRQLRNVAKFCPNCGTMVVSQPNMPPMQRNVGSPAPSPRPVSKKKPCLITSVIILGTGFLALGAIAIILFFVFGLKGGGLLPKGPTGPVAFTDENRTIANGEVKFTINEMIDTENCTGEIRPVNDPPRLMAGEGSDEIKLQAYDFILNGAELSGVVELEIPQTISEGESIGAALFNETSGKWEPVFFQYDGSKVTIMTDHLSTYGVFTVDSEGKRRAYGQFLYSYGLVDNQRALDAISAYSVSSEPTMENISIGADAMDTSLALGGGTFGNLMQSAGYLAYGEDVLSTIGDSLEHIGLLTSVVQIGTAVYNGDYHEATVMSLKTSLNYSIGKAASALGNSVMSASMASIAFVDYSINKFGTTAIEGRKEIYDDAYAIYYAKGQDGYRSSPQWFNLLYPIVTQGGKTDEVVKAEIDALVVEYCKEFWTDKNKLGVDYYVSEARPDLAWTGGGAGLNDSVREDISARMRVQIYQDILPGVFNQIARKVTLVNQRKLNEEYSTLIGYLNTTVPVTLLDEEEKFINHTVRFAPLNSIAVVENWQGVMKGEELNTSMTLLGHIIAGSPNTIEIYLPKNKPGIDTPVGIIPFQLTPPSMIVTLSSTAPSELNFVNEGRSFGVRESKTSLIALDVILRSVPTIPLDTDGYFYVEAPYQTYSKGVHGDDSVAMSVQNFVMEGHVDPVTLSGSASFSYNVEYKRSEHAPLKPTEGYSLMEYLSTYTHSEVVSGSVTISGEGDKLSFHFNFTANRTGYSKLQYHTISKGGDEEWGQNPTITNTDAVYTVNTNYSYNVIR